MKTRIMVQGMTVLALMFLVGSSCADNSAAKIENARLQAQMAAQAQITAAQTAQKSAEAKAAAIAAACSPTGTLGATAAQCEAAKAATY